MAGRQTDGTAADDQAHRPAVEVPPEAAAAAREISRQTRAVAASLPLTADPADFPAALERLAGEDGEALP
jgi:hypothetical protein